MLSNKEINELLDQLPTKPLEREAYKLGYDKMVYEHSEIDNKIYFYRSGKLLKVCYQSDIQNLKLTILGVPNQYIWIAEGDGSLQRYIELIKSPLLYFSEN